MAREDKFQRTDSITQYYNIIVKPEELKTKEITSVVYKKSVFGAQNPPGYPIEDVSIDFGDHVIGEIKKSYSISGGSYIAESPPISVGEWLYRVWIRKWAILVDPSTDAVPEDIPSPTIRYVRDRLRKMDAEVREGIFKQLSTEARSLLEEAIKS